MLQRVPLEEEEIRTEIQIDTLNIEIVDAGDSDDSDTENILEAAEIDRENSIIHEALQFEREIQMERDLEQIEFEDLISMDEDERFDHELMNNDDGFDLLLQIEEDLQNGQ